MGHNQHACEYNDNNLHLVGRVKFVSISLVYFKEFSRNSLNLLICFIKKA